jgi:putative hydrolase of HD superfamily
MGEGIRSGSRDVYRNSSRERATAVHIRPMNESELAGVLEFLRQAEQLKTVKRSAFTTTGEVESVAEHSWRVALMAMLVSPQFPDLDAARLVRMCLVHDLGEAIGGDIPAPEQARRVANGAVEGKSAAERRDLLTLVEPLPRVQRDEIVGLWDEYETAATPVAKLAKALDKLETILQHTQGTNPAGFDYRFNLGYGREHTEGPPLIAAIRAILDRATEDRSREKE